MTAARLRALSSRHGWSSAVIVLVAALSTSARADDPEGLAAAAIGAGVGSVAGSVLGVVAGAALGAGGVDIVGGQDDAVVRATVNAVVVGVGAGVVGGAVGGAIGGAVDDGIDDDGGGGALAGGVAALVGGLAGVVVVSAVPAAFVVYGAVSGDPAFDVAGALVASALTIAVVPGGSLLLFLPAGASLFGASLGLCLSSDRCDIAARSVFGQTRGTSSPGRASSVGTGATVTGVPEKAALPVRASVRAASVMSLTLRPAWASATDSAVPDR